MEEKLPSNPDTALGGIRVLDLCDEKGRYCTKLLADLGAEVLKVEPPGGDPTRRHGPFLHDRPGLERSLPFLYYNTNKGSLTLDICHPLGKKLFLGLVEQAHVVVESFDPGYLEGLGLGYPDLNARNPRLVMASLTGFGQWGPYRDYRIADIVGCALGGLMNMSGDPSGPPLTAPEEAAYAMTSMHAAFGILVALYYRNFSGRGQYIDASVYEVMVKIHDFQLTRYHFLRELFRRTGGQHRSAAPGSNYPCSDGWVNFFVHSLEQWRGMLELMGQPEALQDPIWEDRLFRRANMDVVDPYVVAFTAAHTKEEVFHQAQQRRVPAAPVNTPADLVADPHLQAREFLVEVDHPQTGPLRYPGPPYRLGHTPWRIRRPAPRLGDDNEAIYCGHLGLSRQELAALYAARVL